MDKNRTTRGYELLKLCAMNRVYPYYTQFGRIAGNGQPRNNGPLLEQIDLVCKANGQPLLSVLVCEKGTQLPLMDKDWGLKYKVEDHPYFGRTMSAEEITAEQEKCFAYDWKD